jgi:hypothetical protein
MTLFLAYLGRGLILAGSISGLFGAIRMANHFTRNVDGVFDLGVVLLNALAKGATSKGLVAVSEDEPEQKLTTLQGLGFIFLGFLLQAAGVLLDLITFRSVQ